MVGLEAVVAYSLAVDHKLLRVEEVVMRTQEEDHMQEAVAYSQEGGHTQEEVGDNHSRKQVVAVEEGNTLEVDHSNGHYYHPSYLTFLSSSTWVSILANRYRRMDRHSTHSNSLVLG